MVLKEVLIYMELIYISHKIICFAPENIKSIIVQFTRFTVGLIQTQRNKLSISFLGDECFVNGQIVKLYCTSWC
jgi:hypothetical protein